jgi:hypothetical protein
MADLRPALAVLAAAAMAVAPAAAAVPDPLVPGFAEETATGITTVYAGDWQYMVGGGVAVFDCDGDGYEDAFVAGGAGVAGIYRNTSARGGALTFAPVADSGLAVDAVTGAYPLDVDADGITDLAVLRVGESHLMRGLGGCRFEIADDAWGFDGGDAWATAFAATWEAGNAWPTLAVGTYVDRLQEAFPWGSCTPNALYRPAAPDARRFAAALPLTPSFCALSILFTDWNNSGQPALRVSNDREYYKGGQEQLWRLDPGQPPALYTAKEGWKPLKVWGMGIAAADLDADGMQEYFLTSMADNKLQELVAPEPGQPQTPTYTDIAYAHGLTAHRPFMGEDLKPSTAWHAEFDDVNNDGRIDLFVAKGNVDEMPDFAAADPNNLLLQRSDGTFSEAADKAGVASTEKSRGAALADFNLDGRLDLIVVNRRKAPQVWRNTTEGASNWVALRPEMPGANRDAVGGWIELRAGDRLQRREITVGGGHAGGQLGWHHFGIGAAEAAEVRVIWPGQGPGDWQAVGGSGFWLLSPDTAPKAWEPAR